MNTLRTSSIAVVALVGAALGLAKNAQAADIELMSSSNYTMAALTRSDVGTVDGGEFGVNPAHTTGLSVPTMGGSAGVSGSLFQTFCLELDESISTHNQDTNSGTFVYQWTLNASGTAIQGGRNTNAGDTISAQTAFLYTQFYNGTLSGYNYTLGSGRRTTASALQEAIWYLENELGDGSNGFDPGISSLSGNTATAGTAQYYVTLANNAVSTGQWNVGLGNVRVLNLTTHDAFGNLVQAQDVLVMVPLPPAAYLGLGLLGAIGAVAYVRRRRALASV